MLSAWEALAQQLNPATLPLQQKIIYYLLSHFLFAKVTYY